MEKKEDSCSPVGVLEDYFRSEDSETCSSKEPCSETKPESKSNSRWHLFYDLFRNKSKKSLVTLYPLKLSIRRSSSMREGIDMPRNLFVNSYDSQSPQKIFSLCELQSATNNFSFGVNL